MFAALRRRNPHQGLGKIIFYELCRSTAWLILRVCFGVRWEHAERVPLDGPVLIAANHQSYLDPPIIGGGTVRRQLSFLARGGLFRVRGLGWLITALNSIPVAEGASETAAIRDVIRRLERQGAVLIFPEGSRSADGSVHPFKKGTAVLIKRARCVVVPAAIEGAFDTWPRTRSRPRLRGSRILVRFGEPIGAEELLADGAEAGLDRLARLIDAMRLELRAELRQRTRGRVPAPGPGDNPSFAPTTPTPASPS